MPQDPLKDHITATASLGGNPVPTDSLIGLQPSRGALSLQQAEQDLSDIQELRRSKAFTRYFLRGIRQSRDDAAKAVLEDEALTPEQRETQRVLCRELGNILAKLDNDRVAAEKIIDSGNGNS
jgi:hypothetical protein